MGDADDSYDFLEIPKFVDKLREGNDLVQGCRMPSGGGKIERGAMPTLHRIVGNPLFSAMVRHWFGAPINDVNCGLRGFSKAHYLRLEQRCTGMEFANEMIIKSSLYQVEFGVKIAEVPITLHKDGRKSHGPHLRTFRDGWRTLRFYMLYSPRWLYNVPAAILCLFGLLLAGFVYARIPVGPARLEVHALLVASLSLIMGYQSFMLGVFTRVFAAGERLYPPSAATARWMNGRTLEIGILLGVLGLILGLGAIANVFLEWKEIGFGDLDYRKSMFSVIPGFTLAALGIQTIFSAFFLGVLGMRRK
jgi:hypothetical protein